MIKIQVLKYVMLLLIFIFSSMIGRFFAQKYVNRLKELEELKSILNIIKTKIKFTYEPIPEIFREIIESNWECKNIINIFIFAKEKMENSTAQTAWEEAVEKVECNLTKEDRQALKNLSKMLGQTDIEGQISQIEITENFINLQIKDAIEEKKKNEKLYYRLGSTIGLAIVIILF